MSGPTTCPFCQSSDIGPTVFKAMVREAVKTVGPMSDEQFMDGGLDAIAKVGSPEQVRVAAH